MQCVITPHFIARDPFSYEVEIWFAIDILVSHEINVLIIHMYQKETHTLCVQDNRHTM